MYVCQQWREYAAHLCTGILTCLPSNLSPSIPPLSLSLSLSLSLLSSLPPSLSTPTLLSPLTFSPPLLSSSNPHPISLTAVSHTVTSTVVSTVESKDTKLKLR